MGTLLKVLTVLILLLAIFAFVMGLGLHSKREELIGRTQSLERRIMQLAGTLEKEAPTSDGQLMFQGYDISRVEDRVNDDPEYSNFWDSYKPELENKATEMVSIGTMENPEPRFRVYYFLTKDEKGNDVRVKDAMGKYVITGKGTMAELLDDVVDKARKQYARLNDTRLQLINVRQELEEVIRLYNLETKAHRRSKAEITRLNGVVTRLEGTISALEQDKVRLERQVREHQDTIADKNKEIDKLSDEVKKFDIQVKQQAEQIKNLLDIVNNIGGGTRPGSNPSIEFKLSPGEKGKIVSIDKELAFVVIQLNDTARGELTADGTFAAGTELMIYRKEGGKDTIVSRIKLTNPPNANNLSIAEIVYGWTQTPIKEGDIVIHQ